MNPRRLRLYFALAIAAIWVIAYTISVGTGNYTGFTGITPLMLIVAMWLLGTNVKKNGNDK
jgi:hypothetical protein